MSDEIMRRLLEDQLLAVLREKVLHPDVITYTMKRFEEELLRAVGERDGASVGLRKLEADLERKTANLARSLADGYSASVRAELAQLETQLAGVREKLLGSRQEIVRMRIRDTRRFVESRLAELRTLFNSDPITIRTEIAKHVQKITLTPEGKSYIAAGTWNVLGLGSMDGAGSPTRTDRDIRFSIRVAA